MSIKWRKATCKSCTHRLGEKCFVATTVGARWSDGVGIDSDVNSYVCDKHRSRQDGMLSPYRLMLFGWSGHED